MKTYKRDLDKFMRRHGLAKRCGHCSEVIKAFEEGWQQGYDTCNAMGSKKVNKGKRGK